MKNIFLFPLVFIFCTLKENFGKLIFFTLTFLCFYYANNSSLYDDDTESIKIDKMVKIDGSYVYLYKKVSESKIDYETLVSSEPLTLKDNVYSYKTAKGGYVMLTIIGVILFIISFIILILSLTGSYDYTWDFDDIFHYSINYFIRCEFEKDKFYYIIFGRLARVSDIQLTGYNNMAYSLDINNFTCIMNFPKFKTIREKRDAKLNELGL